MRIGTQLDIVLLFRYGTWPMWVSLVYHQEQAMHGMEPPGHPGETVRYDCIKACERGPPPRQRVDSGVLGQFCPSSSMAAPALRRRWPLHSRARIAFKH